MGAGIAWLLLFTLFVSCQGNLSVFRGSTAAPERRIALDANGSCAGAWQTREVSLDYKCQETSGRLALSLDGRLGAHLKTGFESVEYFHLALFLLDSDGLVLDAKKISLGAYRSEIWEFSLKRSLEIPENTSALAFGYSGKVVRFGGMDPYRFRNFPF